MAVDEWDKMIADVRRAEREFSVTDRRRSPNVKRDVQLAMDFIDKIVDPGGLYDSFSAEAFYAKLISRLEASMDGAACAHEYD